MEIMQRMSQGFIAMNVLIILDMTLCRERGEIRKFVCRNGKVD